MDDKSAASTAPLGEEAKGPLAAVPQDPTAKVRAAVAPAPEPVCPTATIPLKQSTLGGSGSFLIVADDGNRYWCKVIENGQSTRVPLNEQLVGRLGRHVGAAVCDVSLIKIPPALAGWEFRPGKKLMAGYAHGSRAVDPVIETRAVAHPIDDDNPARLASLGILADWCWASDTQWLYQPTDENRYYSHDHGHYFPNGPNWSVDSLRALPPDKRPGLPPSLWAPEKAQATVSKLESLGVECIASIIGGLPSAWPITEDELTEMVFFLERRRTAVLARIAAKIASLGGAKP